MKIFLRFMAVPHHLLLFCGLAPLVLTGCALTQPPVEEGPSGGEAVDVGYGTIDKDHLTGSVNTVRGEDEGVEQPRSLADMLHRVPGVQVSQGSSGELRVRIRGNNTFQGGRDPLFVYNGMVIQSLTGINPSSIESISVLKNADATAIYGSRGANGVILIKTKIR